MKSLKLFLTALVLMAANPVMAELEPLFISGQPGIMIDTDDDNDSDGMINLMYDPATAVVVFQADESLGGGVAIYQILVDQFGTQTVQEIGQFPPTGAAMLTSSKDPSNFLTFFLDTVDLMTPPEGVAKTILDMMIGGKE